MCKGQTKQVKLCSPNKSGRSYVNIDACIAKEIEKLNLEGVITLSCCCGHGKAGAIVEWENGFGTWKSYIDPPHVLISEESKVLSERLGYKPFPYFYADGLYNQVCKMYLKTGCITEMDCEKWENMR